MLLRLAAALALAQLSSAAEVEVPSDERGQLNADQLSYEPNSDVVHATGHCVLVGAGVQILADELTFLRKEGRAVAKGHVMLVMGQLAAVADEVAFDLETKQVDLKGGLVMQKRDVAPEALLAARSQEQLRALGRTVMALGGKRVKYLGPNHFEVTGLSFTPCDCDLTKPSWKIEAASADVRPGDAAILTWPTVSILGVPVLPVPWLFVPLAERRSGLLIPNIGVGNGGAFLVEQPLFLTLGQSYDLTVSPSYYFGRVGPSYGPVGPGSSGPRVRTEFRYAPSERTVGRATFGAIYDLRWQRDPLNIDDVVPRPLNAPAPMRGLRFDGSLAHAQDLGNGFQLAADLGAVSDGFYMSDLATDVLVREVQYLRSTAYFAHRSENQYAGIDAVLRQDMRWGYGLFDARGPNTMQQLPALTYAALDQPVLGPLRAGATVEYSRTAPLLHGTGDEGSDGVFAPRGTDPESNGSQADRVFQAGEREARDRVDVFPRLSAEVPLGRFVHATPYLGYRQSVAVGELTGTVTQRGYLIGGLAAGTELSRTFGDGNLRHSIAPSIEVRSVPFVSGQPLGLYDEIDRAIPAAGLLQAYAEVTQRLQLRRGGQVIDLARLDLGQGFDLQSRALADSYARLSVRPGWFGADVLGRVGYLPSSARLSQLTASVRMDDGQGHGIWLAYDHLYREGADRLRRGIDELVGPPPPALEPRPAQQLAAGVAYRFGSWLSASLDSNMNAAVLFSKTPSWDAFTAQRVGLVFAPSCDCWSLAAYGTLSRTVTEAGAVRWNRGGGVTLTLSRFGSLGT